MHYYSHHIGDFMKDTAHLTDSQLATYLRMIWAYYDSESPIQGDLEDIAFAMRSDEKTVRLLLKHYFQETPDGWRHSRCDREIEAFRARHESAKRKAAKRWEDGKKMPQQCSSNATAMPQHTKNDAVASKNDANHKPITNISVAKATGADAPKDWLFSEGLAVLVEAGQSQKSARAIIGRLCRDYGDDRALQAFQDVASRRVADPVSALMAKLSGKPARKSASQEWVNELLGKTGNTYDAERLD